MSGSRRRSARGGVRVVRTFLAVPWRWYTAERVIYVGCGNVWGDTAFAGTVELTLADGHEVYVGSGASQEVLCTAVRAWLGER